jgi:hypothetical protein
LGSSFFRPWSFFTIIGLGLRLLQNKQKSQAHGPSPKLRPFGLGLLVYIEKARARLVEYFSDVNAEREEKRNEDNSYMYVEVENIEI